ncbi:MAG: transglycosylase SLT domain-containing protein [Oceanibaculum nanhaiense]|nr:transglycosylase SLT domain-containing protein [Oceanibaculum nanhaiense]
MNKAARTAAALAGVALLFAALSRKTLALPGGALSIEQVAQLVNRVNAQYFGGRLDPLMLRAMIEIESGRNPTAVRFEAHIPDSSVGLMQTLQGTAEWLAKDMGYSAFGVPSYTDLLNPETSVYFGASYVDWLRRYRGVSRSERWIVESYNGGPGNSNAQTENHWRKYVAAKAALGG